MLKQLKSTDAETRAKAAREIGMQVIRAKGLFDPELEKTVPALIDLLKDDVKDVRYAAANALANFGPKAKAAIPALIEEIKNKNPIAILPFFYLGADGKPAVAALIEALTDKEAPPARIDFIASSTEI